MAALLLVVLGACGGAGGNGGGNTTSNGGGGISLPPTSISALTVNGGNALVLMSQSSYSWQVSYSSAAAKQEVSVVLTEGNSAITLDLADANQPMLSVSGLAEGEYPFTLTASLAGESPATFTGKVVVKAADAAASGNLQAASQVSFANGLVVKQASSSAAPVTVEVSSLTLGDGSQQMLVTLPPDLTVEQAKTISIQLPDPNASSALAPSSVVALVLGAVQTTLRQLAQALGLSSTSWSANGWYTRTYQGRHRVDHRKEIVLSGATGWKARGYSLTYTKEVSAQSDDYGGTASDSEDVWFIHGYAAAVLGHTLGGDAGTWSNFPDLIKATAIGNKKFGVHEFRWSTDSSFRLAADDLVCALIAFKNRNPGKKVHIVAHSFGGVLTRVMLQKINTNQGICPGEAAVRDSPFVPENFVASVVTLGSPHSGIFDGAGTYHSKEFPAGQDALKFEGCNQISCHQMGEPVDIEGWSLYDASPTPGEIAAALADTVSHPLPASVPITVGIGMGIDAKGVLRKGDGLISYEGQRFHPSFTANRVLANAAGLLNCGDAASMADAPAASMVREKILGAVGDKRPGDMPYNSNAKGEIKYFAGYLHASAFFNTPSWASFIAPIFGANPELPDKSTYAGTLYNDYQAGIESCTAANWGSCQHASYLLVKSHLAGNNCGGPKITSLVCSAATLNQPVTCTVSGTGLLWGVTVNAGSKAATETGTPTDTQRTFTFTPTTSGSLDVSVSLGGDDSVQLSSKTVVVADPKPTVIAPVIATQPLSQSVKVGQTATFFVTLDTPSASSLGALDGLFSGSGSLATAAAESPTYQWYKNGSAISGATAASYTTPAVTLGDNGARFMVAVSNSAGAVTSSTAVLTVLALPVVGQDPVIDGIPASHAVGSPLRQVPVTPTSTATGTLNATGGSFSFSVQDSGVCVQDTITGLYWEIKNAGNVGVSYTNLGNNAVGDASQFVSTLNTASFCGYSDWRLPTVEELQGIVSFSDKDPSIYTATFASGASKTQSGNYWTQDSYAGDAASAWVVSFSNGSVGTAAANTKAYVRLVRGAPAYPRSYIASPVLPNLPTLPTPTRGALHDTGMGGPEGTLTTPQPADVVTGRDITRPNPYDEGLGWSFVKVTANGTAPALEPATWACVFDNLTGLTWENKSATNVASTFTNLGNGAGTDVSSLIQAANNDALCGHNDWRLPNADELQNIVHYQHGNPAINTNYFSPSASGNYWTNDSYAADTNSAWVVSFGNGSLGTAARNSAQAVRLVRGLLAYGGAAPPDAPAVVPPAPIATIGALNDTGYALEGTEAGDGKQDTQSGRDFTAYDDRDGVAGFSFTKITRSGAEAAPLATDHVCVRDNVTGLLWDNVAGVNIGSNTSRYLFTNLNQSGNDADVASVIALLNSGAWCGRSDWRLPTTDELQNIVHYANPGVAADVGYFSAFLTQTGNYWTQDPYQGDSTNTSWVVNFTNGSVGTLAHTNTARFRLVSGSLYLP